MKDRAEVVRQLVARDKLDRALKELTALVEPDAELSDEVVTLRATLERTTKKKRRNLISDAEEGRSRVRVQHALLSILSEVEDVDTRGPSSKTAVRTAELPAEKASVFISYSHADARIAQKLKQALTAHGVEVRIDVDHMCVGESISDFIRRSIRETAITVSIVSDRSLLSDWVAFETLSTLWEERSRGDRRLIACYTDDSFLAPDFGIEGIRKIDGRLEQLDRLIREHLDKRLDPVDLNDERSRLLRLRNGLGEILERLKGSLTLDIREPHFARSVARVVEAIGRSTS